MILALILAALVVVVLFVCWLAEHERLIDQRKETAKGWGAVDEKADEIELLKAELRVVSDDRDFHRDRANKLLAKVYDLGRDMGLRPTRAETACVDAWADGRQPCEKCAPLLPAVRP